VGGPISVHVKEGKIIRVRPLIIDENDLKPWKIEAGFKEFSPPRKVTIAPFVLTERQRLNSQDRIRYPMKRVDFNPHGERHQENRGKSGYVRISWEEASSIVAEEIRRVQSKYGKEAVTAITSSHHNWGTVGYKFSPFKRFFNMLGFTPILDNPDSWEGFHWGATHAYGYFWRLGCPEQYDLLEDALKNTQMVVYWSNDPDTTRSIYTGQETARWRLWLRERGIKQVFIDPFCNYTAAVLGDKWLAPRPGTDSALALAIAYTWVKEGTYDQEYISKRTLGFEKFAKYLLGETDGIPKTPEWASKECDIPARVIIALAREWGAKRTMLGCGTRGGWGGAGRQAYGTEWARLMVLLQAMQGLGKPGVNLWSVAMGGPTDCNLFFPGYSDPEASMATSIIARIHPVNPVQQKLYRILFPDAILNPPIQWTGDGFCGQSLEQQFTPHAYPLPGHSEVKMFYRYGSSFLGTMTHTNKWIEAYQSPKLEFVVNQDCWWGGETGFADIVLPACTNLERLDISEWGSAGGYSMHGSIGANYRVLILQKKCVEPVGESLSDYDIFSLIADRLGFKEQFTENRTFDDWVKDIYNSTDFSRSFSWEQFYQKGYHVIPLPENYQPTPAYRWYYEGKACNTPDRRNPKRNTDKAHELSTYSGKLEFVAQSLLQHFPDDKERPPMPQYLPSWEGHSSELAKKYPLQIISPHPRFSFHTHYDKRGSWVSEIPGHRILKDGNYWQVVRIHSKDAESRSIKNGDLVNIFNDRGAVLGIAQLTERIRPGVVHCYESSSQYDPLEPGKPGSPDRGGCINLITPSRLLSKNAPGMAPNSCLVEIAKWEDDK